ncbi:threonine-phosphate decarboxylase CobD [Methylocystis bryophila]|uniref:threonine-phosphate decarboxylase n=1 Tax=Methylocystis bryophila TaxID=655015 RepID=A0A1W6MRQ1_9HYPH|nr:threonine-phosphate decarboxylase CobD [Methylocystis bryophila]ARN80216.1 threonine-phosphate decarboxylase [Methylocystis bryophila]BDV40172.1 threonine-phosphate decarboxylase [Methylocystis bryophila]
MTRLAEAETLNGGSTLDAAPLHGGGVDAARRAFPLAPSPWLDLSTGVNPRAYPLPAFAPEVLARLPDASAFEAAEAAAARAYGAPPGFSVVAGAGTQAFIDLLPRVFPARRVATLGFCYAEHAARWRAAGASVTQAQSLDELATMDVAIVVNPNNPDGRIAPPSDLLHLARRLSTRGGLLVVDEAFADFTPELCVEPLLAKEPDAGENLVVLRSFGKAYGLPGLRLGFALCAPPRAAALRAAQGPWGVSGPALAAGARALADSAWLRETRDFTAQSAQRLDSLLAMAGLAPIGGTSLFRLVESVHAARSFARLCSAGILARRFDERPSWLRFGLPAGPRDFERLAGALGVRSDV